MISKKISKTVILSISVGICAFLIISSCTKKYLGQQPENIFTYENDLNQTNLIKPIPKFLLTENAKRVENNWNDWRNSNWKEQLNAYIKGDFANLLMRQSHGNLALIKYQLQNDVYLYPDDSLLIEPITNNTLFPVYFKQNNFKLVSLNEILGMKLRFRKNKAACLKRMKSDKFKLVIITWKYKEKVFYTQCIISQATYKII